MSNTINDGGPAFPVADWQAAAPDTDEQRQAMARGMSLRDHIAIKAMASLISQYPCQAIDREDGGIPIDCEALAEDAYVMADAMLEARSTHPEGDA